MIDTTLLDSTAPISMEALQAFFQANDFSTMVSRYDAEREQPRKTTRFFEGQADLSGCLEQGNGYADEKEFPHELF